MEQATQTVDIAALNKKIQIESAFIDTLTNEVNKVIVGQRIFHFNFIPLCFFPI